MPAPAEVLSQGGTGVSAGVALKQLVTPFHLAVCRILDLQPRLCRGRCTNRFHAPNFANDALEVALAGQLEKTCTASGNRIKQ